MTNTLVCVSLCHLPQPEAPEVASMLQRPRNNTGGAGEAAEQNDPLMTITFVVSYVKLT